MDNTSTLYPVAWTAPPRVEPKPLPPAPNTDMRATVRIQYVMRCAK